MNDLHRFWFRYHFGLLYDPTRNPVLLRTLTAFVSSLSHSCFFDHIQASRAINVILRAHALSASIFMRSADSSREPNHHM